MLDQLLEWPAAIHAGVEDYPRPARLQEVLCASARVGVGKLLVPFGTKKRVGSEQGAGTHPGDDRKLRACAGVRQAHQSTRAERPIGAAAREREDTSRLSAAYGPRSPRDALYGYRREAVICAEHANAARRIGRDIPSRWRWRCHDKR